MTAAALQPPFAYFGGKTTLATRIVDLLPPHEHYAEMFCGGSSVLLAKAPSTMETVNDLDGRLIYLDIARAVAMHLLRRTIAGVLAPISPYRLSPTFTGLNRGTGIRAA